MKDQVCRYCGERFQLAPNKPGYVDECTDCLYEKTASETLRHKKFSEAVAEVNRIIEKVMKIHNMTREEVIASWRESLARENPTEPPN